MPSVVFSIVILIKNEARVLRFTLGTFLGQRLRGILLRLIGFILSFSLLLTF